MVYADKHPTAKLYPFIAEQALADMDITTAQSAFMKSFDYLGIQFIKKLLKIQDHTKQRAEIAIFYQKYDEAERIYLDMDRKDLAIDLKSKLGDWMRVVQLIKAGGGSDDSKLNFAWNALGDYYYDRQKLFLFIG